jgi:hypothetical protein
MLKVRKRRDRCDGVEARIGAGLNSIFDYWVAQGRHVLLKADLQKKPEHIAVVEFA